MLEDCDNFCNCKAEG
uniref:Uncharacterized protein n=1 Tax=Rhizophora mucronata TaxID=61149 RepID=A0A2P2QE03_RHIMU